MTCEALRDAVRCCEMLRVLQELLRVLEINLVVCLEKVTAVEREALSVAFKNDIKYYKHKLSSQLLHQTSYTTD